MGMVLPELRANMARLRESLWTQMQEMEADLMRDPLLPTLLTTLCKSESKWHEIEQCHGNILAVSSGDPVQREILDLRALYLDLNDRVQIALEDNQAKEEARLLHRDRVFEAHVLGERWKYIYRVIDASVNEIMAQLKGGPNSGIGQLEVISIKFDAIRTRLEYVEAQLDAAQSLADSMVSNYPEQTMVTIML